MAEPRSPEAPTTPPKANVVKQVEPRVRWLFAQRNTATTRLQSLLGASWVAISGVINPLIWVIIIVTLLVTPLLTTHEPPSRLSLSRLASPTALQRCCSKLKHRSQVRHRMARASSALSRQKDPGFLPRFWPSSEAWAFFSSGRVSFRDFSELSAWGSAREALGHGMEDNRLKGRSR